MPAEATLERPTRILAIDVLRGITVAFMILVNDAGDWGHVYKQLDHAEWSGWTLTDLVFPTFLFLIGASTVFSLDGRIRRGDSKWLLARHIFVRAFFIFAIKMTLSMIPRFHMTHLRIYGVLTRIALCYLVAGLILLRTRSMPVLAALSGALLAGYWAIMRFIPVPGFGVPTRDVPLLDPDNNIAAWIDRGFNVLTHRYLHTGALYEHTRDPEGLLSTLPAIATVLLGAMAALWIKRNLAHPARTRNGLLLAGLISFLAGLAWNPWFPINKKLWTSSYVLMAAGWALVALGLFYWLMDMRRFNETRAGRWITMPALIFGSNALFAYVLSELLVEMLLFIKIHDGPKLISVWGFLYQHLFAHGNSTYNTSLAFAIAYVLFCFLPTWLLYRKRIFLKL